MKKGKKFSTDEEVLDINVMDAEGNPIKNETEELTEEQVNFCSKLAYAKYKKFSASKVKKFDAETESIDVQIPEDIENADIEALAQEASDARDAAAADATASDEVVVNMTGEEPTDECAECAEMVKEFAAKMRKFSRKARKFDAEDLEPIKQALEEVTEAVEDLVEDETPAPAPEAETIVEACQQFCASLKKLRQAKKFSAEDLEELEKIEDHIEDTVEEINNTVVENPEEGAEGVSDIKKFNATATASALARHMGSGSIDSFKAQFFSGKK